MGDVVKLALIIVTAAVLFAFGAAADPPEHYLDGNELYSDCNVTTKSCTSSPTIQSAQTCLAGQMRCYGYIMGTADAYDMLRGAKSSGEGCTPRGVTPGQIKDVVVRFLQQHPEMRHTTAAGLEPISKLLTAVDPI